MRENNLSRFLVSGAFNTIVSYAVYMLLLCFFSYAWAYSVAYVVGIICAYFLQRYFVFRKDAGITGVFLIVVIYISQYFLSVAAVVVWVKFLKMPVFFAPAFAIFVVLPVTFFANRWVFLGKC